MNHTIGIRLKKGLITCKEELCKNQIGHRLRSAISEAATSAYTSSSLRLLSSYTYQSAESRAGDLDTWRICYRGPSSCWVQCHTAQHLYTPPYICAPNTPLPRLAVDTASALPCAFLISFSSVINIIKFDHQN